MLNFIGKLYKDSRIRYLFFGGLTTLVNMGLFALLKGPAGIDYKISNFLSVAAAICFAFIVNKLFVFQSKTTSWSKTFREFCKFVLGRLVTMAVEVGGVPFCVEIIGQPEMLSKLETQIIVTVVNYFISKLLVFKSVDKSK
ncbi:GtrA family protein [Anaerostipes sp.]|uniref:GtrA family protein n=1 Tax=Anaerostipes sp. TaxID=1872530 RepID=UPI0025906746|nr:GtrA family protein [Anaerostipes sp.]MCI5622527.1 GtrA family protein [Anaerostipes sp.]